MYAPEFQSQYPESSSNQIPNPYDYTSSTFGKSSPEYASVETPMLQNLRINFTRKVFTITAIQLFITGMITHFFVNNWWFTRLLLKFPLLIFFSGIVAFVTSLALGFSTYLSRKVPTNYILLGIFTVAESCCIGVIANEVGKDLVLMALYLTIAVVTVLALYAIQSKTEITYHGGLLLLITMGMLMLSFFSWFTRVAFFDSLYFVGACVLSGLYFIYDIKLLMGKDSIKMSLDDYIKGSMHLYIDIVRIFMNILEILVRKQEKEEQERKRR
jgi:FtsH-binding integral membrane protein